MEQKQKQGKWALPLIGALLLIVSSVAYIVLKMAQQQADNEKWKDYDDSGWC